MPSDVPLAKEYVGNFVCRICGNKTKRGRKEIPLWMEDPYRKHTFVCEECLIKNKKGELSLK